MAGDPLFPYIAGGKSIKVVVRMENSPAFPAFSRPAGGDGAEPPRRRQPG